VQLASEKISSDEWMAETHKILKLSEKAFLNTENPLKNKGKILKMVSSELGQNLKKY
jgi:hypothetical protein